MTVVGDLGAVEDGWSFGMKLEIVFLDVVRAPSASQLSSRGIVMVVSVDIVDEVGRNWGGNSNGTDIV